MRGFPRRGRGRPKTEELSADEELSQYGSKRRPINGHYFKRKPGPYDTDGLSMSRGRIEPKNACTLVGQLVSQPGDGVRYTTVGALRGAGFQVRHTPNQGNPGHVSVSRPGVWDQEVQETFEGCFTEAPQWVE